MDYNTAVSTLQALPWPPLFAGHPTPAEMTNLIDAAKVVGVGSGAPFGSQANWRDFVLNGASLSRGAWSYGHTKWLIAQIAAGPGVP